MGTNTLKFRMHATMASNALSISSKTIAKCRSTDRVSVTSHKAVCVGKRSASKTLPRGRIGGLAVCSSSGSGLWTPGQPVSYRPVENIADSQRDLTLDSVYASGREPPSPMVQARMQQVLESLFQQRIVRLGGAVDDDMCNLIVAQLLYLEYNEPGKDVTMYVNSPGGSVTAGMAVFDTMRYIKPDISTVCVGLAASMGAFLLSSGTMGKRFTLPNSRMMIHQPLGGAQGQAADIEIQANEIMHHKATLSAYLSEFTKQPMDTILEDTDRDFFMGAEAAVEYGLVDGVIDNLSNLESKKIEMFPEYDLKF